MKPFLIFFSLFISSFSHAQSRLPICTGEYWNNCYGSYIFPEGDKFAGDKYVGEVRDNKWNGQGKYSYANGDKYEGQFKDGKWNGQGTYTFANRNKYVGQFKDNKYDGFGTLYNANGSIYQQGLWRDDVFVQAQTPPPVIAPVVPKPPVSVSNPQEIKRQKCIRLGLAPGSVDFQQCMN